MDGPGDLLSIGGAKTRARPIGRLPAYSLRISLLEQCQLRCGYCLPGEVKPYTPRPGWLTLAEHARLAPLFSARGIAKVRFTGGEPLLRDDVADVLGAWRHALPAADLALTTNGGRLGLHLDALVDAGLNRINVHVDTLDPDRYRTLMGDGDPRDVLAHVAVAAGQLGEVKLNVVAQRGLNDDELLDFLAWSRETGIQVRFIELMDTGSAEQHVKDSFLSGDDILARLAERATPEPVPRRNASDPAALFRMPDDDTVFGLIASDTRPFCDACDRLRLGADGRLRGCLYAPGGVDLRAALREGAGDDELLARIDHGLDDKRSWHPNFVIARPPFSMADVGG